MPIRSFSKDQGPYPYKWRLFAWADWNVPDPWSLNSNGQMASQNHFPLDTSRDDGGPWLMIKSEDTCVPAKLSHPGFNGYVTIGEPRGGDTPFEQTAQKSDAEMAGLGTTAIARSAPNNPSFNFPQAIGELRQGGLAPKFREWRAFTKAMRHKRKAVGGQYLQYQFGWAPFVNDLRTFAKTVNKSHEIWNSYKKGSGSSTRVGYHFPSERDYRSVSGQFVPLPAEYGILGGFLEGTRIEYVERKTWFKGAFRYFVPDPSGNISDKFNYYHSEASKLLGVRLTPDTVWNLNPWTWAADWFANTGDLMTNVSNLGTDGLYLQYGYVMDSEEITTVTNGRNQPGVYEGLELVTTRTRVHKRARRVAANPYGFYATLPDFTTRQLAIMAALGLSYR